MGISRSIARIVSLISVLALSHPLFPVPVQIAEEPILVRVNEPTPSPQLEISTNPKDAWVYIEGNLAGSTPLILKDLPPSFYGIQVQKAGYRPLSFSVTLKTGIRTRIQLELEPAYGTLSLENAPPECQVYVGGTLVSERNVTLPAGRYRVVVKRFGYEDIVSQITIQEGKTTEIPFPWKRVPLSVSRFTVAPSRIHPENRTGPVRISFWISSPAETTLRIQDGSGKTMWARRIPEPDTPFQQVNWDGRDSNGNPLPDGTYRLILQVQRADTSMELSKEITIDRKIRDPLPSTFSGLSGLLFVPDLPRLEPGYFRISSWILGQVGSSSGGAPPALAHAGIFFPLQDGWELTTTLSSYMEPTDAPPDWVAGLGIQYRLKDTGIVSLGMTGKGTYMNQPREYGFSQIGGLSLGVNLEIRYGFLGFLLSPELTLSPYTLQTLENQLHLYGSFRGGCYVDLGALQAGISSVLWTNVAEPRLLPIYHTGIEVHWKPPTEPFTFSLTTVFIQPSGGNLLIYMGGGLGAVY